MIGGTTRRSLGYALRAAACAAAAACAVAQAQPGPAAGAPAADTPALAAQIAAILAPPGVARDHWGIVVTTLDGTPLYALNEAQLFQPASNAKLFTTAAVMALLPPSHVFTTRLEGIGLYLEDGTLKGDLFLHGVGDANLSGRNLPYVSPQLRPKPTPPPIDPLRYLAELADQVKAAGIMRIDGDILADDALKWEPYPQDWTIDDAIWGYAAPVSGLSVADNQLKLTIRPGVIRDPRINAPLVVTLEQAVPYYTVDSDSTHTVAASKPAAIDIERDIGSRVVRIHGQMPANAPPDIEELAIEDPAEYALTVLKKMLEDRGIIVTGAVQPHHFVDKPTVDFPGESTAPIASLTSVAASKQWPVLLYSQCPSGCTGKQYADKVLATHTSPPLVEDVVVTNKESLNLHAELMLRQLGLAITGVGSTAQGARVVRQFLINAGLEPNDFIFFDGSGLSGHDLVTPRATAKLLSYAAHDPKTGAPQPWFADWKASLPVGGEDGTLASKFPKPPLKDHLYAKTGTLGEARALSGYLDCASGRTVIFSILVGNHLPGTTADRDAMDQIVAAIAAGE
jgi:serine-type D-Ala-D-Ala carboxypeptidase/endopeptidase (penicillin-binding protein 4)